MQACAVDAPGLGRRAMLGALAVPLLLPLASSADALPLVLPAVARPPIHPRADWATGRPAKKRLAREDVRFLLVHHTQTPNVERPASIPGRLRGMYDFHTGEKGWPDLAYNFLVDPFGGIWEGRTGSLAGPVRGDATGGSQGYAQLCCFIGDHTSTPPTPEAMAAMGSLLGWLASRYAVDLAPGRRVTFVSRGSNRWPRGRRVSTDPIAGHRDMSLTQCPGDALYPLVGSRLWPRARAVTGSTAVARQGGSTSTGPARPTPKPTQTPTTPASSPPTTSAATPLTPAQPPPSSAVATPLAASASVDEGLSARDALPVVGVLGVGGGAAIAAHLARRPRR